MSFVKVTEDWIKLTDTAKLNYGDIILLCKIDSLSNNEDKVCTASNAYFARLLCTTERNVQRYLEKLKKAELIKTFEQKEGMKTTTRYIYPQYKKIIDLIDKYDEAHDNSVTCSEQAHDNSGMSTRQFVSEHTTDLVKAHDNSVTQIREKEEIKERKREKVANAPKLAALGVANAIEDKWIPKDDSSKEIFGSDIHTDKKVIEILNKEFGKVEYGIPKTVEDICKEIWVTACHVNTNKIAEYCTEVLMNKGEYDYGK